MEAARAGIAPGMRQNPAVARLPRKLPWLAAGEPLPPPATAWGPEDPVPGIVAAGGALDVATLLDAYGHGIFPWFGDDQPILWWSPDPRMVLRPGAFRLHRSLRKTLLAFRQQAPRCEVRIDHAFADVIAACAEAPRAGQSGTWILPEMQQAYVALHRAGHAHSVETWIDGQLAGGLYCVALGRAVFGESMFARRTDASKIALAALVAFCRHHGVQAIDCQQNTAHLASLGASEWPRAQFLAHIGDACRQPPIPAWQFDPIYWNELLPAQQ